ncbi:hypothetical protein HYU18_00260 [Candidatus Woesearchaeota archaeon]|nr:hypothetical protein [Candidatus Woesearchaeota archaeon]
MRDDKFGGESMARRDEQMFNADVLRERIDEIKHRIADIEGNFEKSIGDHPFKSVAAAFGAGVMLGALGALLMKRK